MPLRIYELLTIIGILWFHVPTQRIPCFIVGEVFSQVVSHLGRVFNLCFRQGSLIVSSICKCFAYSAKNQFFFKELSKEFNLTHHVPTKSAVSSWTTRTIPAHESLQVK